LDCQRIVASTFVCAVPRSKNRYAADPAMIEVLCPPKPKLLLITVRSFLSRGVLQLGHLAKIS
jgi:hypothetical protein